MMIIVFYFQKCADDDVSIKSKYPTFARTYPPVVQVTKSLVALLLHFKWMKFTMVVGSSHKQQTIADKLLEYADMFNITVNDKQEYSEPYMPFSNGNPFPGIIDRTYVDTRGSFLWLHLENHSVYHNHRTPPGCHFWILYSLTYKNATTQRAEP